MDLSSRIRPVSYLSGRIDSVIPAIKNGKKEYVVAPIVRRAFLKTLLQKTTLLILEQTGFFVDVHIPA